MPAQPHSHEKRHHVRYQLNTHIFVDIQGEYCDSFPRVADLSSSGIGIHFPGKSRGLEGKVVMLDLVNDQNIVLLRSLLSQVVFCCDSIHPEKRTVRVSRRYGLKFVDLSELQKKVLQTITKKYALTGCLKKPTC